ncbi:unnamed protein product [Rotaria sp. Silwood2]|nr:unnamed protein product [Rotaria sp. Silwood2]CAF2845744.1 unnamed protein product [Rotaria sp. Silwood2]CAF3213346.1 unnamed protein product [Rotaria sp. Silwood2]CAF3293972.1 unnamed protein product [Rotaria sp. Silwood2]CAF4008979.1 unnamed protein product [Rotaria sp. Silwood2]
MDTDMDRSHLQTANRFGQLSKNMFFARHVPQPKFLKFITGTAGVKVCHVRDDVPHLPANPSGDLAKSLLSDPRFTIEFPPNSYNEALLRSYAERIQPKRRRERFLPPIRGWNPSGTVSIIQNKHSIFLVCFFLHLVEDTENWRRELSRIAEMVGLVTADELAEIEHKREPPSSPLKRTPSKTSNGEYSQRTGRWNETPKTLSRSRSLRGRTPLSALIPNHLFCVDEQEREMWMLQVLCQILKTEDINEVQSWLVSSSLNEKDAVRQLITSAIKGLEESGRIQPTAYFNENTKSIQAGMDTLGSIASNKFPSESVSSINENTIKPNSRPRTSPQIQSTTTTNDFQSRSTRAFQTNLEPIDEEKNTKTFVPQPTKVDSKRDIQVLTLSDDGNNNQQITNRNKDEVPF